MQFKTKHFLRIIIFIGIFAILYFIAFQAMNLNMDTNYMAGVTFSRPYAIDLGINPDEALIASLDDLGVRHFRIPAYWSLLQPVKNQWNWEWLDNDLNAIAERGGTVTLAIGHKLPRWPECWTPIWARDLSEPERELAVKELLTKIVERYKNHPAVVAWQVENEPNFPFGICPSIRKNFIDDEIALVRSLDSIKPIATTDSGELSLWSLGKKVDYLGVSVYRTVISPIGIFNYWFVPPQFYLRKGQLTQFLHGTKQVYISEYQMEPWVKTTIPEASLEEQYRTFNLQKMQKNITHAKNMGVSRIDFWGVEWWYYMKTIHNTPEFWEQAKQIFK